MLEDFLHWYLSSWQRMDRKKFGLILTLATVPGMLIMVIGWGSSAGSFLEPLLGLMGQGGQLTQAMNGGDLSSLNPDALQGMLSGLTSAPTAVAGAHHAFDWSGLVNTLCLLACVPMCRMRLLDMGWQGRAQLLLVGLINLATLGDLVHVLTGFDVLPLGWVFSLLNFAGYMWLMLAKSKPQEAAAQPVVVPAVPVVPPAAPAHGEDDDYEPHERSPWK